jgi:hypothetical protein
MIIELGAKIGVRQSVAISDRIMLGLAEIPRARPRNAPACRCQPASIGERDPPVAGWSTLFTSSEFVLNSIVTSLFRA